MQIRISIAIAFGLCAGWVCEAAIPASYEMIAFGGTNVEGIRPRAGVVLGPDGNYYGTASDGGALAGGTVFKLTPDGLLTNLVSFSRTQGNPTTAPIVGSDGNLYGTTDGAAGGVAGSSGTIYRVSLTGALEILATFPNAGSSIEPNQLL